MLHSIQPLRIHYFIQTPVVFWCNSFFLFLKCLLASNLTLFTLSTMLWFGSCTHCILTCFFWFKNSKHSPSSHGSCCFNSQRPRLSLTEVVMFSLMFSQAQFMPSFSLKFSKAAKLYYILSWYCFLTYSSLRFLRLKPSTSNFCAACLSTAHLSLTFAITRQWSVP